MHTTLVTDEAMNPGYGIVCRRGFAEVWNNGNYPGMFSFSGESGFNWYNPRPAVYLLVEPGSKELTIDNTVTNIGKLKYSDDVTIYPNPASWTFAIKNIPTNITSNKRNQ